MGIVNYLYGGTEKKEWQETERRKNIEIRTFKTIIVTLEISIRVNLDSLEKW